MAVRRGVEQSLFYDAIDGCQEIAGGGAAHEKGPRRSVEAHIDSKYRLPRVRELPDLPDLPEVKVPRLGR
jgi:hypothetical protein